MSGLRWRDGYRVAADRVTPVEVFFDVVFVFTLTQLTHSLEDDLTLAGVGRVLLLFGILWWMFTGYVWLPNHVPPVRPPQKLLLFVAMAGFLLAAIAIPHAYDDTGVLFGAGYLLVTCVHLLLFTQAGIGRALTFLAPYNLVGAALVLAGGFVDGPARYVLWLAAFVIQGVLPYLLPRYSWVGTAGMYHITPEHFVERHGLLVIIALGESVVAIGMGVDTDHITPATVAVVALALALPACLWWTYFTDARAARTALENAGDGPRSRLAIRTGFAHIPLLVGIIVAAAGIHTAVAHPGDPASWASALALSGGVAAYLAGMTETRHSRHDTPVLSRLVTAVAVLATTPLGAWANAGLHLAAVVAVLTVMLLLDVRGREGIRHDEPYPPSTVAS